MEFVYLALVEDNPHLQALLEKDDSSIFNDGSILWSSLADLENVVGDSKVFDEEAKEILNALKQGYSSLLLSTNVQGSHHCFPPPLPPPPSPPPPSPLVAFPTAYRYPYASDFSFQTFLPALDKFESSLGLLKEQDVNLR